MIKPIVLRYNFSIPSSIAIFSNYGCKSLIFQSIKYPPINSFYYGYSKYNLDFLLKNYFLYCVRPISYSSWTYHLKTHS